MRNDYPNEYKKGFVRFLGYRIELGNHVFIPRPETAFWLKKAIKAIKERSYKASGIRVLDIFSGSGSIGIAVLKKIEKSLVDFVDVDEKAVRQIKTNLNINNIPDKRYRVVKSDLFGDLKGEKYDFILANPPYVAEERIDDVQPSVLFYEPKRALFGGKDGLFYIRKFLKEAKSHLRKGGIIFMEIDPYQKEGVRKILAGYAYKRFNFFKDQFGKFRFVIIGPV